MVVFIQPLYHWRGCTQQRPIYKKGYTVRDTAGTVRERLKGRLPFQREKAVEWERERERQFVIHPEFIDVHMYI